MTYQELKAEQGKAEQAVRQAQATYNDARKAWLASPAGEEAKAVRETAREKADAAYAETERKALRKPSKALDEAQKVAQELRGCREVAWAALQSTRDAVRVALGESALRVDGTAVVAIGTPHVSVVESKTWDRYSKGWHNSHGPALKHTTTVAVGEDWLQQVHAAGIAVVDGLVTLAAEPVDAPAGYSAWRAVWIVQGRGYSASADSGVIVREDGRRPQTAHADTVDAGVRLLKRRARAATVAGAAHVADLQQHRHVHVALTDARRAGLCDPGIRAWCARAAIDPSIGATIGQVLDALDAGAGQRDLAVAACRMALRGALSREMTALSAA